MASDDDDVDLDALRSAVLATLKTRDKQNASPQLGGTLQRDTDIENLRNAALHSARQTDAPLLNHFGSHPRGYHREFSPRYAFANSPGPRSNLIVIQPVVIEGATGAAPLSGQLAAAQRVENVSSVFQCRPQDRYCRTTEDEASQSPTSQKNKRADKFSRYQSDSESDSDDDDYFLKSDNDQSQSESESPVNGGSGEEGSHEDEDCEVNDGDAAEIDPIDDVLLLHPNEKIAEEDEEPSSLDAVHATTSTSADGSLADDDGSLQEEEDEPLTSPGQHSSQENSQQREEAPATGHHRTATQKSPPHRKSSNRRQRDTEQKRNERSRRDPTSRDKDVFGKEIADTQQDFRRSDRSGDRVESSKRRDDRIRDVTRMRPGRTDQQPTKPKLDSRRGGDQNKRRRPPSPPLSSANRTVSERHEPKTKFPLQSASRNTSAEEQPYVGDTKSEKRGRSSPVKSRVHGRHQQALSPRPPDDAHPRREAISSGEPLHDLREKLKFRSRDVNGEISEKRRRKRVVDDNGSKKLARRGRSRSPGSRRSGGLQSIVKQKPPRSRHSKSKSLGASPVRSPGRHSPVTETVSSKRSRSPAESLNPRKVLIVKEKSYVGDDMLSSRHGFNVMLSEVPDLPDSDSSASNRLPVHLRLGHFAKSSSSLPPDASTQEEIRPSNHSSSDGKTASSSRHSMGKKKSRQPRPPDGDAGSPKRHVKLKRESSSSSAFQPSARSATPSNGHHSSKRTQKQSGRTYESELDEKIRRIKEVNEAILKRKTEIERDQQANY